MNDAHESWATGHIKHWDKSYKPRWVVFKEMLADLQNPVHNCLDIGCGSMTELEENLNFKLKIGTDLIIPQSKTDFPIPFLQADFYNLPFKNNSYDIILLRFVVEHIEQPKQALTEFFRVLKPEGKILIMTTNLISPIIFLPKLLPYSLRRKLIQKLFAAGEDDLFPTFHYLNTKRAFQNYSDMFDIVDWKYIQDVNWNRKWLFGLFFTWHLLTRWFSIHFLRSNINTLLKSRKK